MKKSKKSAENSFLSCGEMGPMYVVEPDGMNTVASHAVPLAWFVAMKMTGTPLHYMKGSTIESSGSPSPSKKSKSSSSSSKTGANRATAETLANQYDTGDLESACLTW